MPTTANSVVKLCERRFDTALALNQNPWKIRTISPFVGLGKWIVSPRNAVDLCRAGSDKWPSNQMGLFVRVDLGFYTHRKTLRLFTKIGESAFWVPPRLWSYAASQQIDGEFEDYSATEIAMLIGYNKDAASMLQALIECGFMDVNPLRIHDWNEYNAFHAVFSERAKKAAHARWSKEKERTKEREQEETETETEKYQASISIAPSIAPSIQTPQNGEHFSLVSEPPSKPSKSKGSLDEVLTYAKEIELQPVDGEWFYAKCEGCGWKNNRGPINDWRQTMRTWKLSGGIFPSHKLANKVNGNTPSNKRNEGMTNKVTVESGKIIAAAARATVNQARAK